MYEGNGIQHLNWTRVFLDRAYHYPLFCKKKILCVLYDATAVNIDQVKSRQEPETTVSEHIGLEIKETALLMIRLISWNFRVVVITMGLFTAHFLMLKGSSQLDEAVGGKGVKVGGGGGGWQKQTQGSSVNTTTPGP